ncbi:AraC family transcriptional regulator [Niameybacter massiliensis]|uniref:AraC family transcriptional regulator n=1 Tax=Holtiella tumoricola TaxID=3018743 RepID=A0AA42DLE1_9FIRM|nr:MULTISPECIES: AraC family transcriptional regulator [Lachnospirales]MDA3731050.1 AraC family transcriptional regulator [Holtiella tumoricola]
MKELDIRQMVKYIDEHITDHISLTNVAQHVNYSPYYCSVCFKESIGTSIKSYILKKRLQYAAESLCNTNLRIIDIAYQYGYSSQEAFSRAFSTFYGISPYEYRQKRRPISRYYSKYVGTNPDEGMKEKMITTYVIDKLQEDVEAKYSSKVLHILNGGCMLERFQREGKMREGCTYISFNEAMCWGEADEVIFSEAFIKNRVRSLKGTKEQYEDIVLKPLEPLFKEKFDTIVLWFGDDMFCQINMLTVIGFLEQISYTGDLLLCMACESMDEILPEAYELELEGSLERYRDIVCKRKMPALELLPVTYQMVKLYLEYRDETSEISRYIIKNINKDTKELLRELLTTFSQYGLGDLQYEMMIEELRRKNIDTNS